MISLVFQLPCPKKASGDRPERGPSQSVTRSSLYYRSGIYKGMLVPHAHKSLFLSDPHLRHPSYLNHVSLSPESPRSYSPSSTTSSSTSATPTTSPPTSSQDSNSLTRPNSSTTYHIRSDVGCTTFSSCRPNTCACASAYRVHSRGRS